MKKIYGLLLLVCVFLLVACTPKTEVSDYQIGERKVVTQIVAEEAKSEDNQYIGYVVTDLSINHSFKIAGKINNLLVKEGQFVKSGSQLASLETKELNIQKQSSQKQIAVLNEGVKVAEEGLDFAKAQYEKGQKLLSEGAISKIEFDQMELNYKNALASYAQAGIQKDIAGLSLNSAKQMIDNAVLLAEQSGYVAKVLYKPGEVVAAGYPVLVIRSENQVIEVGVTQEDMPSIVLGEAVQITLNNEKLQGKVVYKEDVPDEKTRTYLVKLALDKGKNYPLGAVATVHFQKKGVQGIWIPLLSVLNDGEDYVYVQEEGLAFRKNIKILGFSEDRVRVEGLTPGMVLVIEGMQDLKEGYRLNSESKPS